MSSFKKYNPSNFFKHTFCEFKEVNDFSFTDNKFYKSKSNSKYYYTEKGVYRKSNHWGRVANCRWKLIALTSYKNQKEVTGFAKWTDFNSMQSLEKQFVISVDYKTNRAKVILKDIETKVRSFNYAEAQQKLKEVNKLLKNDSWTSYYNYDSIFLKRKIIEMRINSDESLAKIKISFNETFK
ncbi:hypothetical protein [Polaribacter sp.]|uniref:hypothetical protein n=1 Tax=Polaribacter sp. TaxID=1920175 RepID=UPI0025F1C822|nr:hypothetical protein [Polaribacter sp.]